MSVLLEAGVYIIEAVSYPLYAAASLPGKILRHFDIRPLFYETDSEEEEDDEWPSIHDRTIAPLSSNQAIPSASKTKEVISATFPVQLPPPGRGVKRNPNPKYYQGDDMIFQMEIDSRRKE